MNAQPVSLEDRILAALAEKPRTELALRGVFPRVHPDALHIKLTELRRAGRVASIEGAWRLTPGSNAAPEVERVQAAARAVKREPLPPPPLDPGPVEIGLRECKACGESKPLTDFNRHPKGKDGRRRDCKKCQAKANVARRRARLEALQAAVDAQRSAAPAAAATVEPAPEPPAAPAENVLQFPAPKAAPKTLEDVVNRRATVSAASLESIMIADPVTGRQQLVLSADGLRALREHLAGTAAG